MTSGQKVWEFAPLRFSEGGTIFLKAYCHDWKKIFLLPIFAMGVASMSVLLKGPTILLFLRRGMSRQLESFSLIILLCPGFMFLYWFTARYLPSQVWQADRRYDELQSRATYKILPHPRLSKHTSFPNSSLGKPILVPRIATSIIYNFTFILQTTIFLYF